MTAPAIDQDHDRMLRLASNLQLVDELYALYLSDPSSVDATWRALFEGGGDGATVVGHVPSLAAPHHGAAPNGRAPNGHGTAASVSTAATVDGAQQVATAALVHAYRVRGHLEANLDPLGQKPQVSPKAQDGHPDLHPESYGFDGAALDRLVANNATAHSASLTLRQLLARLRSTYCGDVGYEYMHISDPERRRWLQERIELTDGHGTPYVALPVDADTKGHILDKLIAAAELERFIHQKYVGTKRFSIEGGETLLPLLDLVLERAGSHGVEEAVLGMAHRGRLNVLTNILGKKPSDLFAEFEDLDPESTLGAGDVKYHLGYSSDHLTRGGAKLHLSLAFNPSHLEAVDPVVVGRVRAKQRRRKDDRRVKVLGILIHGDAAFAGQGLVAETLNLSDLRGFRTGGTVHVIVNNQIGFTTAPTASRSTPYPTDLAKAIQVPIFHVNGDNPEAVARAVELAMDYRQQFATDVVVDLFCFRRYGHNEGDEPSFTQPLLYDKIKRHPAVYELYGDKLVAQGVITREALAGRVAAVQKRLDEDLARARSSKKRPPISALGGCWESYVGGPDQAVADVDTGVERQRLAAITEKITTIPEGFRPHPKVVRLLETRAAMGRGEKPLDWGMAETLAFGSLLWDGVLVRVSGQDSRRGTFSHRHATMVDVTNGEELTPLTKLHPGQGDFTIYDSMLSEAAVMGFEFGFSLDYPDGLVIWEAQFGDFVNGAQVILDQFVSSAEDKWKRLSGLTLLLPHGYEGQGPEHSSARFERFLQLAAEDNMQVCYPTTPAQIFHLLRRQVLRPWRKPLVVLSPKSLLRLPEASSPLESLTAGRFQRVLDDPERTTPAGIERVMLCAGKVYYELAEERRKRQDKRTAIVRLEQLYPLREELVAQLLDRYTQARELVWVQEEPANMGANQFLEPRLRRIAGKRTLRSVTRPENASPATGSAKAHQLEQRALLAQALD
jgi:2-oxoglutarate dehydrogenase E1 component